MSAIASPTESVATFLSQLAQGLGRPRGNDSFPSPPKEITESFQPLFRPDHDLRDWALNTFVHDGAILQNPDHAHLQFADILFVWSSVCFRSKGKGVVGTAQRGIQQGGGPGKKEYLESFYREWNGGHKLPDFIITICAPYVIEADPASICSLIDHELYHCGQERDEFGYPKYTDSGLPKFALRDHDISEFVGVVKRYGDLGDRSMIDLRDALNATPTISRAQSDRAVCGCGAKV